MPRMPTCVLFADNSVRAAPYKAFKDSYELYYKRAYLPGPGMVPPSNVEAINEDDDPLGDDVTIWQTIDRL